MRPSVPPDGLLPDTRRNGRMHIVLGALAVLAAIALAWPSGHSHARTRAEAVHVTTEQEATQRGLALATFAGGCFWCTESDFRKVQGVVDVVSGYTGGHVDHPTYEQVALTDTGHVEAVQVTYDPKVVSYRFLLDYYWRHVDPLDGGGQFSDRGSSYRPMIFTHSAEQKAEAEATRAALSGRFKRPIKVAIEPAGVFWPAEIEHQDYAHKHPWWYGYYRHGSGRDARLDQVWGSEARGPHVATSTH